MQRRHRRGLSTTGGAGQGLEPGPPLASDSEDDELPWRPALGDAASPRVVLESDPEEPDVCPDVRGPRKRRRALAPGRHPDAAAPCPDPDVGGPKKRRFGPQTTPDPDVGRKMAVPHVQPPNRSPNPPKAASPDVKHLEGSNLVERAADVKVPPETALFHPNCHRAALEVSSHPDVEEREPNPDVGGVKSGSQMLAVDSDTDVEEAEVLPDVGCPKIRSAAPSVPENPGAEMETPNPDVGGPKNGCWTPADSDTDVEAETSSSAVGGPQNGHQMLTVDSDTDVEEARASPDVGCPPTHQMTQNVPKNQNIEMETQNADVEGSRKGRGMLTVDSDTDVEENGADPDVGYPKTPQNPQNAPKPQIVEMEMQNADVEGSEEGHGMLVVDSDTDVEENGADPDVGYPKTPQNPQNAPKPQIVEMETQNADVEGSEKGRGMLVVDSDTDVEEDTSNPDVGYPKTPQSPQNAPKPQIVEMETQNADVEGSEKGHGMLVVDSDTDVEEDTSNPDVGYPKTPQSPQNAPKPQIVEMETQNADVEGSEKGCGMLVVDSDTDVEEDTSNPDVGYPKTPQNPQNAPKPQIVEMETQNADVEGSEKGHGMLVVDSDTDVEEDTSNPDVGYPKTPQNPQNAPKPQIVEMETQNADVEGSEKGCGMLVVDSDTDVEEDTSNPDVGYPKTPQSPQNAPKPQIVEMETQNADVEGSEKGRGMLVVDSDTDVEEDTSNPDVGCPESHRTAPSAPDVKAETTNRDVEGRRTLLVESDTDVEEEASNPDVGTPKPHGATQNVPRSPEVETKSPNPRAEGPRNERWTLVADSDTDVEENEVVPNVGRPKIRRITRQDPDVAMKKPNPDVEEPPKDRRDLEVDSDTDVEEENLSQRVLCPKSHKTPRNTRKDPTVVMETPNPDVGGLRRGSVASNGDSDTDVEDLNAFPNVGAPKPRGTTREVVDAVAKMAAAPDVDPEGPTRTSGDPDVKVTSPTPDAGAPEAQCPLLNVDSDTDVEDNGVVPDVGTARRCRGASGDPDVAARPRNPDVASPTSPRDGSDTDVEEVAPTPDVRSLRRRIRIRNRPHPDVGGPAPGSDSDVMGADPNRRESPPKRPTLSPESRGDTSAEGPVPKHHDSAPNTDVEAPNPDVGAGQRNGETPRRGEDPAVPPDVPPPKSPRLVSNLGDADGPGGDGATPGRDAGATVTESDTDVEEDPDLFLEPTQNFLPPVAEDVTPNWDPEEPTQPFFLPEEEEEEPPQDPPDAPVPPAEPVTVTPAWEGTGTGAAPGGEVGEGPRRSQRLARSRGGGATGGGASGKGGAGGVGGGAPPLPAPVRRSPRLQARPPPPELPVTKGRGQDEPRPLPKPRPPRAGPAPSKRQAQEEEEEPAEVTGHQLRPRGGPGSTPPKVLFTGVVASPAMEVALKTLGGSMATSVFDCTHLVTDRVRRTVKFLCAVARGVPIVTPEWLHKSARSGRVLVPGPFLVRDSQQERHFGFSLAQALRRARRHPLLQGYEVHVTPNVRPEPEHMRDIVTCSGGTFLPAMPHAYGPRRLVISCEADAGCWAPALSARLPLASAELLLTGLLRQRLELPPFLLPLPHPPPPPPNPTGPPRFPPSEVSTTFSGGPRHLPADNRAPPAAPGTPRGCEEGVARGRNRGPPRDPPGTRRRPAAPPTPQ